MHEKMETDPVCSSGGLAAVRKYACMGGRDSGSRRTGRRHPGTQRKAGRTDPRRRAWEVYKKGTNRRGTCRRGNTGSEQLFFGSGITGNDPAGDTPCLRLLEYNGI